MNSNSRDKAFMKTRFNKGICCIGLSIIAVSLSINAIATEIFVTRDKDGNPVFSDQPSKNAEKIIIQDIQTVPRENVGAAPAGSASNTIKELPKYNNFSIVSPKNDENIRENTGAMTILLTLEPELRGNDTVALYMDGAEVASGRQLSFDLANVDRGTHTLQAKIKSAAGKSIFESNSVTVHLQRISIINRPTN